MQTQTSSVNRPIRVNRPLTRVGLTQALEHLQPKHVQPEDPCDTVTLQMRTIR